MTEQVTVSQEFIDDLQARIEALEARLAEREASKKDDGDKGKSKKLSDSIEDFIDDSAEDAGKIIKSLVDASVEAMNETAEALSSLSEDTDQEKLGKIPSAIVSVFRRSIDIQKKAVDKFEESYGKEDSDD